MYIFQNSKGQTAMDMNLELRDTDNVILSFDPSRHTKDRQTSRMLKSFGGDSLIKDYVFYKHHISNFL